MKLSKKWQCGTGEKVDTKLEARIFYKPGIYSITLNPADKYQFLGQANRLQKFRNMINEMFLHYPEIGIDYVMNIELSEPRGNLIHYSAGPRLHLHGTINLRTNKSVYNWLIVEINKLLKYGNLDIDTIDNLDIWYTYCTKQKTLLPKGKNQISNYENPDKLIQKLNTFNESEGE